jgi:hypothetical protein
MIDPAERPKRSTPLGFAGSKELDHAAGDLLRR